MMRLLLSIWCLIGLSTAWANPAVEKAKDAFWNGKYGTAASLYAQLVEKHPRQADLWYNLGTSEAHADRLGYATFAFEQCLALTPSHGDARHNLERVRQRVTERALAQSKQPKLVLPGNDDLGTGLIAAIPIGWLQLVFCISWFLLFILIYTLRRSAQSGRRTAVSIITILIGLAAVCSGGLLVTRSYVVDQSSYGVVIEDSTARKGPGPKYALQTQVSNSVKVRLGGRDRGWRQVTLPNGQGAWMPDDAIKVLKP